MAMLAAAFIINGSWETSRQDSGILFTGHGKAVFYTAGHMCPTALATYAQNGNHIKVTDLRTSATRTLQVTPEMALSDPTSGKIYRRVTSITMKAANHC
jgi:hypothetical protein